MPPTNYYLFSWAYPRSISSSETLMHKSLSWGSRQPYLFIFKTLLSVFIFASVNKSLTCDDLYFPETHIFLATQIPLFLGGSRARWPRSPHFFYLTLLFFCYCLYCYLTLLFSVIVYMITNVVVTIFVSVRIFALWLSVLSSLFLLQLTIACFSFTLWLGMSR